VGGGVVEGPNKSPTPAVFEGRKYGLKNQEIKWPIYQIFKPKHSTSLLEVIN
jgi:hypothetical protein